jgi:hypothetical protein
VGFGITRGRKGAKIMATLSDYYNHGELDQSYHVGVSEDRLIDTDSADICHDAICPKCGIYGLKYLPFYKAGTLGRSFAECPNCQFVYEF